jgi:protein-disulfide isomerase
MNFKLPIFLGAVFVLASCTSGGTSSAPKGSGTYPNSIYTASGSKDIQSAVFGAPNSKVQLKIYSDYQCPACIVFHKRIEEKIWTDYIAKNQITVTFLNFPLTFSGPTGKPLHENAEGDALASFCALADGKYHEYRNALYNLEETKKGTAVTDEERVAKAKELGMDANGFSQCLTQAWYQKALEREIAQGDRAGLEGTPSVYINDALVKYANEEEFFKILDLAIRK